MCYLCRRKARLTADSHKASEIGVELIDEVPKSRVEDISKDRLHKILEELIKSHEQIKKDSKMITQELLKAPSMPFEQAYQRVKEIQPEDPLERHGLSLVDFDHLLDRHQNDPTVRSSVAAIMGAPSPGSSTSERVQMISVKEIIEIHVFMLEALEGLTGELQSRSRRDVKTATIAAQCIVNAKVEAKFNLTSEDLEIAVLNNFTVLATDTDFVTVSLEMQSTMGKFTAQ